MSIVAVVSSPRKGGNTETIVNAIADGAKENGKDVKVFYLNSLANKKGCQGCNACKKVGHCVTKDDLTPILDAIRECEGLIISSPVYFGEACGQYRVLEDRYFGFLNGDFTANIAPGKKVAVVTSCGSSGADVLADKMSGIFANYLKFDVIGKMTIIGNDPNTAKNDAKLISEAKAIGKKF